MYPTLDGVILLPGTVTGLIVMGWDSDNGEAYAVGGKGFSATRELPVSSIPGVVAGSVFTDADTAVGVGATAPLPFPPAGTARTATVQNTAVGALVRVREVGGAAGSGILLAYLGTAEYEAAVAALEVENVGAVAATVAAQYERT
jgi:hypothetical protein